MLNDLRYALRTLFHSPGFTIVAVLALALGSGVNTAIFSVIDAVLLRPLPFPHPDRLVKLDEHAAGQGLGDGRLISISYPNFVDLRSRARSFTAIAGYRHRGMNLVGTETATRVDALQINWEFGPLLGLQPAIGRTFTSADDRVESHPVAILTEPLWTRDFGRDHSILGRAIRLDGRDYTIVGVAPRLPEPFDSMDVLLPLSLFAVQDDGMLDRANHTGLHAIAALAPGVTVDQARRELTHISSELETQYPLTTAGIRATTDPFLDTMVSQIRPGLWMLFAAVGFVLLIACVNVANLMLARSTGQRREVAIRAALGAGRGAIVRQFLTESLVLSFAGAILGTLAAAWIVAAVVRFSPADVARLSAAHLDPRVLCFTLLLTILSAILFGLAPALGSARTDVIDALRTGGRGSSEPHARDRMRTALLIAEVALSMVLLAGAGLMLRTVSKLAQVDPGFDPHGVLALDVNARDDRGPQLNLFWDRALDSIRSMPGVRAASATANPPFEHSSWSSTFSATNAPPSDRAHMPSARFTPVATDFFRTMGIHVLNGRDFTPADLEAARSGRWTAVVNQSLAHAIWGARDPVGQRIQPGYPEEHAPSLQVIGVVSDVKQLAPDIPSQMEVYLTIAETPQDTLTLMVRASGDPLALAPSIEREIHQLAPNVSVFGVRSMQQKMAGSYARQRFLTALLAGFAALGLALACIGIYGVSSYIVARATHEIGVRMALGAGRAGILRMIFRRTLAPSIAGLAIGIFAAIAAARAARSLLFGVSAADPATLLAITAIFLLCALLASAVPTWRAMRVDPMSAVRAE